jgi:TolA-binding protein
MSKMVRIAVLALISLYVFGCTDVIQDDDRFRAEDKVEKEVNTVGMLVPNPGEVDLVEGMALYRNSYRAGLEQLVELYSDSGDTIKLAWAKNELRSFLTTPKYKYLMVAEIAGPELKAVDLIIEATELFDEAMAIYNDAVALLVVVDEDKLRLALSKFNDIIALYPTSDKIDDAAYKAGRIHDHFRDYEIAAVYYQRTFQWNTDTRYPARSRAAYVMDKRLNQKDKALALYQLAVQHEKHFPSNVEYAKERILALTKSDLKLDNDKSAIPEEEVIIEDLDK